jgi:hypothetical protein
MNVPLDVLAPRLAVILPLLVWIGGMIAVCLHWRRQPAVAAIVLIGLGSIGAAALASYLSISWIQRIGQARGMSVTSIAFNMGIIRLLALLVRTSVWIAMFVASFGWRPSGPAATKRDSFYRFSIRGVMLLTFVVAVVCAVVTALIRWLGEFAPILWTLAPQIPLAIVWYVGARVAFTRWKKHPQVSAACLIAIGLSATSLLLANANWIFLTMAGVRPDTLYWLMTLACTILSSIAWMFLIAATLGGRSDSETDPPVMVASESTPQHFTSA